MGKQQQAQLVCLIKKVNEFAKKGTHSKRKEWNEDNKKNKQISRTTIGIEIIIIIH